MQIQNVKCKEWRETAKCRNIILNCKIKVISVNYKINEMREI